MLAYTDTFTPGVYMVDYIEDDFGQTEIKITSDIENAADLPGLLMKVEDADRGFAYSPTVVLLGNVIEKCYCKTEQISDNPTKFLHTFIGRTA